MKQKIYIGAAAIVMAGIFLLAGGKPVVAKAEKIKKVKIASAEKTVLINKKEKIQLKAKVKPASMKKKVRWKSSNKKVVTVSQKGVIRGKRYGKANIWLKAADGSGKKAKIKVQVGRKVTSVSFAVKKQELEVGQKANFETLDAVQQLTGEMPLVLHGGTGIPEDMIKKAISLGVSKINVNTECQLSFAAATRKYIEAGKDLEGKGFDPRKLLAPGAEAIKATVKEKMELFGSVGKA